jgi:predicted MFS family arabinose efflux permease
MLPAEPASPDLPLRTLAAAVALSALSIAPFLVLPQFVEGVVTDLHYSERQVGFFSAFIGVGSMLSALAAGVWVRRVPWHASARWALLAMLAANLVSLRFHAMAPFLVAQCVAGFAGGALYSLALTILSDGRNPDRNFGFSVATQVGYQILGLLGGPSLLRAFGIDGLLCAMAAGSLLGLACVPALPAADRRGAQAAATARLWTGPMAYALAGCFLFYFNVGIYWTYIQLIGRAAGHDAQQVANALALGVGLGLPGALLAAWLGERGGRLLPLGSAAALVLLAVLLARGAPGLPALAASAVLYNFGWNFSLAYQYAAVHAIDRSGRGVAVSPAFAAAGIAAGPALAAWFVGAADYAAVVWLSGAAALASFASFWLSARAAPRPAAGAAAAGAADTPA